MIIYIEGIDFIAPITLTLIMNIHNHQFVWVSDFLFHICTYCDNGFQLQVQSYNASAKQTQRK